MKKAIANLIIGLCLAVAMVAGAAVVIGAVMFLVATVSDIIPTDLEKLSMILVLLGLTLVFAIHD